VAHCFWKDLFASEKILQPGACFEPNHLVVLAHAGVGRQSTKGFRLGLQHAIDKADRLGLGGREDLRSVVVDQFFPANARAIGNHHIHELFVQIFDDALNLLILSRFPSLEGKESRFIDSSIDGERFYTELVECLRNVEKGRYDPHGANEANFICVNLIGGCSRINSARSAETIHPNIDGNVVPFFIVEQGTVNPIGVKGGPSRRIDVNEKAPDALRKGTELRSLQLVANRLSTQLFGADQSRNVDAQDQGSLTAQRRHVAVGIRQDRIVAHDFCSLAATGENAGQHDDDDQEANGNPDDTKKRDGQSTHGRKKDRIARLHDSLSVAVTQGPVNIGKPLFSCYQSGVSFSYWLHTYGWIPALGALWGGALILHLLVRFLCRQLQRALSRRLTPPGIVLATLPESIAPPLCTLIWILALIFSLEIVFRQWVEFRHPLPLIDLRTYAVLGCVAWWLLRWNHLVRRRLRQHVESGKLTVELAQVDIAGKIVSLAVLFVTLLLALQVAGVDIRAIIALSGFGAIALGLAGRDVFSNLFSGVMLYLTRPFVVTDSISLKEKGVEGMVEKIGWYLTRLKSIDKSPQYLPNSLFSTAIITNITRMTNRRLEFKIGLRYQDLPLVRDVIDDVRVYLRSNEEIDQSIPPQVWFVEFGVSSLELFVRAYTRTTEWGEYLRIQQEVLLQCAFIIQQRGAAFSVPTTAVEVSSPLRVFLSS
jgi:MscS family membrane protein